MSHKSASSPYINHFLQPDTIIPDYTNPQSWNRYAYVINSPIGYNDPTGHSEGCGIGMGCVSTYEQSHNPGQRAHKKDNSGSGNEGGNNTGGGDGGAVTDILSGMPSSQGACEYILSGAPLACDPDVLNSAGKYLHNNLNYCQGLHALTCLSNITQDIALGLDVIGVAVIEVPSVLALGPLYGEGLAALLWNLSAIGGAENIFSIASTGFTLWDDWSQHGTIFTKNSYSSFGTTITGLLPLTPSWDLAVDTYGSARSHGGANELGDILLNGAPVWK